MKDHFSLQGIEAQWDSGYLTIQTPKMHTAYRWTESGIQMEALTGSGGMNWVKTPIPLPHFARSAGAPRVAEAQCSFQEGVFRPYEEASLVVRVRIPYGPFFITHVFQVFPEVSGIAQWVELPPGIDLKAKKLEGEAPPKGVELGEGVTPETILQISRLAISVDGWPMRLVQAELHDSTDWCNDLAHERVFTLHRSNWKTQLEGNLFFLEDCVNKRGLIFLKEAPLPHAQPVRDGVDVRFNGRVLTLCGHGLDPSGGIGYPLVVLPYDGTRGGRICALQKWRNSRRRFVPDLDGRFITNTWGDRSQDGKITEAFVLRELEAVARLGADALQIDDGWQLGTTSNSALKTTANQGRWSGFWEDETDFWAPHPQRFPHGLEPVFIKARELGVEVSLWYAGDSVNGFANWRKDADQLLKLHRQYGVRRFKIDSVEITTKDSERNLRKLVEAVHRESGEKALLEFDITASRRPGYFGEPGVSPLFLENRYTDWGIYWPHHTLRNLWQLSHYLPPRHLRMEFLNVARNPDKYPGTVLDPIQHSPDFLFASIMFANPLGWFEAQNLPDSYFQTLPDLVHNWKQWREEAANAIVLPVGMEPDGMSWTGFAALRETETGTDLWLLSLRENHPEETFVFAKSLLIESAFDVSLLSGCGELSLQEGCLQAHLPSARSYALFHIRLPVPLLKLASLLKA